MDGWRYGVSLHSDLRSKRNREKGGRGRETERERETERGRSVDAFMPLAAFTAAKSFAMH